MVGGYSRGFEGWKPPAGSRGRTLVGSLGDLGETKSFISGSFFVNIKVKYAFGEIKCREINS